VQARPAELARSVDNLPRTSLATAQAAGEASGRSEAAMHGIAR
jgi:hypothetical protein